MRSMRAMGREVSSFHRGSADADRRRWIARRQIDHSVYKGCWVRRSVLVGIEIVRLVRWMSVACCLKRRSDKKHQ